jgi:hypothetical protein
VNFVGFENLSAPTSAMTIGTEMRRHLRRSFLNISILRKFRMNSLFEEKKYFAIELVGADVCIVGVVV